jgi:imidazolonepropionase-like amidohydrolase
MSRRAGLGAFLLLLAAAPAPRELVVVKAGRVYTGTGEVLERTMIVIENGRILELRPYGPVPPGATVVEADGETVVPGLIDAHTSLADGEKDDDVSVTLDVRASDGFDPYASSRRLLEGGVTSVGLSPGSRRLVPGLGAVVKTGGRVPEGRMIRERMGLRVLLGESPKNPPPLYDPPLPASAERPIAPVRPQSPVSRMGQFALLRRSAQAMRDLQQPIFVQAHGEDDLLKAVLFAEEAKLPLVLVDAEEAPRLAEFLGKRRIPVILNTGFVPGARDLSDASRPATEPAPLPEEAVRLIRAGVPTALQAPRDAEIRDLLFVAAAAVRHGFSEQEALAAVTRIPAEILGVADRVGSLRAGRDADLVFLDADPFAAAPVVNRVMIDGALVFRRKPEEAGTFRSLMDAGRRSKSPVAIRGARLLTVTQGPVADGLLLIEDGKIGYAGRSRPIPPGAKIVEAAGMTITPGFMDAASHLGFHVEGTEAARRSPRFPALPATAGVPPSSWIDLQDPVFRRAAEAGVTSLLLSPDRDGICSLLKLSSGKVTVVREVAAMKFSVQGGPGGRQALKDLVGRGRKYVDDWAAYERAVREAAAAPKEPPRSQDALSGVWTGEVDGGPRGKLDFKAELKLAATDVTGTLQGTLTGGKAVSLKGAFVQNELKAAGSVDGVSFEAVAKLVAADHLKGSWSQGEAKGVLEARRAPSPAPAPPAPPKAPKKDEALEPYRKLLSKEIPAIVAASDLPSIEAALHVLRKDHGLDLILSAAPGALPAAAGLLEGVAGLIFGPGFMDEAQGARINVPEVMAAQGFGMALASQGVDGTRHLPLLAAYAVREGLDPFDALKALTAGPARLFRMEQRLGALERGRDADLVFWSGDPFLPGSQVLRVWVDGQVVFERK